MAKMYDPVELKAFGETFLGDPILKMAFIAVLRNAPMVEVPGAERGEWEIAETIPGLEYAVRCSNCRHITYYPATRIHEIRLTEFCPDCGAKMAIKLPEGSRHKTKG